MMRSILQQATSLIGAVAFLVCMGMLLTRPTNFAAYLPEVMEVVEVIEKKLEDPTIHVVLDAGHGGIDGGTTNRSLLEKDLALEVCHRVKQKVDASGLEHVEVVLTREDDLYLSLHQRVALANRYAKSYFVSVHFNASRHRSASGTETFYASPKPQIIQNQIRKRLKIGPEVAIEDERGKQFAQTLQQSLVGRIGSRDRGIRNNPKLILPREVIGPSALIECVFRSNPGEAAKLQRSAYLEEIASGIASGIVDYVQATDRDPYAGVVTLEAEHDAMGWEEERGAFAP